ncbi:MAG TPA: hypothetical protein VIQ30_14255 [Pseudonocardia sp.]
MTLRNMSRYAAGAVALAVAFAGGIIAAPADAKPRPKPAQVGPAIPHCATEDGGPQQVCIWDSAVDGNKTPAAPNNVVFLYVSRPGQDPEAIRIK